MDFKGRCLVCFILVGAAAVEDGVDDEKMFANYLDDGENANKGADDNRKFEILLARIELLDAREKARDHRYMNEIRTLRRQLTVQTRRVSFLENRIKRENSCDITINPEKEGLESQNMSESVLQNRIQSSSSKMRFHEKRGRRIRRAENESNVAFFATLAHDLTHVGIHQPIVFNNVTTNIGNAYNSHFGSFIAPVPGTYVFSATLFSHHHVNYHVQFVKNGNFLTNIYMSGSESGYASMSQTVVLQLQRGDDVCIQNNEADNSVYGGNYCTFSGFLLQEDFSSVAIVG